MDTESSDVEPKDPDKPEERIDRRLEQLVPSPHRRNSDDVYDKWQKRTREACVFFLGLAGAANQLFFADPPNPVLFPIIGGLLAIPFGLRLDDRRKERDEKRP